MFQMRTHSLVDQIREHSILCRDLNRDSLVVDLGMNDGRFAREIHAKYGCRVVGVEPNPTLAKEIGRSPPVSCDNLAIAATQGFVRFQIAEDPEASHIVPPADGPAHGAPAPDYPVVTVPCVPLRTFFRANRITRPDLLKIDIEGDELQLFEGDDFTALLEVEQITVEFHAFLDPAQRPRVKRIISRMRRGGFHCIDFSATWKDVLFINERLVKLGPGEKIGLAYRKYATGLPALFRKIRSEGGRTVARKVIARRFAR
jgi:FkbM family methyltransferase